jgi:uncharacterized protein YjbI with pentapeptide repeats
MAALELLPSSGPLESFVGVRQRRVLSAWEHARMASSSSIRPAGLKGSLRMIRFGALAGWLRVQRGDLAKDAIISVVVGVALLFGAMVWDARLTDRQNDLANTIAERQDQLGQDLANQAEVLENTRFVRQIATTKGKTPKPFASINLSGAQLVGLSLPCTDVSHRVGCADFRNADLREANLRSTDLVRADLSYADLRWANLADSDFSGAELVDADLGNVASGPARFQGAHLRRTRLIQARLEGADFRKATLLYARANEADLTAGDFRNAYLKGSHFKHADLRGARFSGAEMVRVDLTSADLRGADFTRADLRTAVLTDVCFDHTTKWGSNPPPASSSC